MKIFLYILLGIAVAIPGFVVAAAFQAVFNGFSAEINYLIGLILYLCITIVVCTCLIMSKLK